MDTTTKKFSIFFNSTEKYTPRKGRITVTLGPKQGQMANLITADGIKPTRGEDVATLSIVGDYYVNGESGIAGGGQCADTFRTEMEAGNINFNASDLTREQLTQLLDTWQQWHLNDLTAGTPAQTKAVAEWKAAGNKYEYGAAKEHLKTLGLAVDASMANYAYGSAWLTRALPQEVVDFIHSL